MLEGMCFSECVGGMCWSTCVGGICWSTCVRANVSGGLFGCSHAGKVWLSTFSSGLCRVSQSDCLSPSPRPGAGYRRSLPRSVL